MILPLRGKRHPELGRLRLVVTRAGVTDDDALPSIPTEKDSSNCFYMLIGFVLQNLKFFQLKVETLYIALLGYLTDNSVSASCGALLVPVEPNEVRQQAPYGFR